MMMRNTNNIFKCLQQTVSLSAQQSDFQSPSAFYQETTSLNCHYTNTTVHLHVTSPVSPALTSEDVHIQLYQWTQDTRGMMGT